MDQYSSTPGEKSESLFDMNLDVQNSGNLRSAAGWAKMMGVCGIIVGGLFVAMCLYTFTRLNSLDYNYTRSDSFMSSPLTYTKGGLVFLILVGVIFILGGVFAFGFGNKLLAALKSNDQSTLNSGFASLRNYFAVRGITMLLVVLFLLLALLGSGM